MKFTKKFQHDIHNNKFTIYYLFLINEVSEIESP